MHAISEAGGVLLRRGADPLHTEDQLPRVEHAPKQSDDGQTRDEKQRPCCAHGHANRCDKRRREETEPREELQDRDVAGIPDSTRAQSAPRGRRERHDRHEIQEKDLHAEPHETLWEESKEPKSEGDDIAEEHRARDGPELGVPAIAERADMDRKRDEEESEETGRGRHQGHIEVVPQGKLLGHQAIPRDDRKFTNRSLIEPDSSDCRRYAAKPVSRELRILSGYAVAVAAVAVAMAIKYLFNGLGASHPFVLLPAAVIVAAWYGGRGPGLLAAVAAAVGADILFLPPAGLGVLSDDLFALVALFVEAILIVEVTVRLRTARALARREATSADLARREASLGLHMREELLTFLSTKLDGPLTGMVDGLISARSAVERGESTRAIAALDGLAGEVRVLQRTTEHWLAEARPAPKDS